MTKSSCQDSAKATDSASDLATASAKSCRRIQSDLRYQQVPALYDAGKHCHDREKHQYRLNICAINSAWGKNYETICLRDVCVRFGSENWVGTWRARKKKENISSHISCVNFFHCFYTNFPPKPARSFHLFLFVYNRNKSPF